MIVYADVESAMVTWLLTTDVAPLVLRSGGGYSIYKAMPVASPVPSVILSKISGGPKYRKDIPEELSRISFDCWGANRLQANTLSLTLMVELESLSRNGGYQVGGTTIGAAEVVMHRWLPDPESDTARYIVDALVTTVTQ